MLFCCTGPRYRASAGPNVRAGACRRTKMSAAVTRGPAVAAAITWGWPSDKDRSRACFCRNRWIAAGSAGAPVRRRQAARAAWALLYDAAPPAPVPRPPGPPPPRRRPWSWTGDRTDAWGPGSPPVNREPPLLATHAARRAARGRGMPPHRGVVVETARHARHVIFFRQQFLRP